MASRNATLQLTLMTCFDHFNGISMNGGPIITALKNFGGSLNPPKVTTKRRGVACFKNIFHLHFHNTTTNHTVRVFSNKNCIL